MASLPNAKPVTYEEWLTMPEVQDAIQEVVNGEIRIIPVPTLPRPIIVQRLLRSLDRQLDEKKYFVFSTAFGLIIRTDPLTSRVPDVAVFDRSTVLTQDGYIHSAPQLVIEVLSPSNSRRERGEKLGDYAMIGVPEVWLISPEARTIEILLLENGFLRRSQILAEGLLQPKLFPHVSIDIATIWPD
jgi:Uma2 family endonuclease